VPGDVPEAARSGSPGERPRRPEGRLETVQQLVQLSLNHSCDSNLWLRDISTSTSLACKRSPHVARRTSA
jgi:hypothetical protein